MYSIYVCCRRELRQFSGQWPVQEPYDPRRMSEVPGSNLDVLRSRLGMMSFGTRAVV